MHVLIFIYSVKILCNIFTLFTLEKGDQHILKKMMQIQGCHITGKTGNSDVHFSRWETQEICLL